MDKTKEDDAGKPRRGPVPGSQPDRNALIKRAQEIAQLADNGHSHDEIAAAYDMEPDQVRLVLQSRTRREIRSKFNRPFLDLELRALRAFDAHGIYELARVDELTLDKLLKVDQVGLSSWDEIQKWKGDHSATISRAKLQADQKKIRHVAAAPTKTEIVRRGGLLGGNGKPNGQHASAYLPPPSLRQPTTGGTGTAIEAPKATFKFCPHCGEKL